MNSHIHLEVLLCGNIRPKHKTLCLCFIALSQWRFCHSFDVRVSMLHRFLTMMHNRELHLRLLEMIGSCELAICVRAIKSNLQKWRRKKENKNKQKTEWVNKGTWNKARNEGWKEEQKQTKGRKKEQTNKWKKDRHKQIVKLRFMWTPRWCIICQTVVQTKQSEQVWKPSRSVRNTRLQSVRRSSSSSSSSSLQWRPIRLAVGSVGRQRSLAWEHRTVCLEYTML